MTMVNLDALRPVDIPAMLQALNSYFISQQFNPLTQNIFLSAELLATRWELSTSNLNHWRARGYGPRFIKLGPGVRAKVRYPMLGEKGVLDFEQHQTFCSTRDYTEQA